MVNPKLKVIGTGLGIGPLKKSFNKIIFKFLAKNFNFIYLRENQSLDLIEKLNIKAVKKVFGDDLFLFYPVFQKIKLEKNTSSNLRFALNLKFFPGHDYQFVKEIINNYLCRSSCKDSLIEYYCFGRKPGPDDRALVSIIDRSCIRLEAVYDPYERGWKSFVKSLSEVNEGVGFAYHFGTIMSLLGIPVVSVYCGEYYKQKILMGLSFFNKHAVVISVEDLLAKGLEEFVNLARSLNQEEIQNNIEECYKSMVVEYSALYYNCFS